MLKKLIIFLFIVSFLPGCKKDTISLTGNIDIVCKSDNIIGAGFAIYTMESYLLNEKDPLGDFEVKSGILSKVTQISDLNPGDYIISFYKELIMQIETNPCYICNSKLYFHHIAIKRFAFKFDCDVTHYQTDAFNF